MTLPILIALAVVLLVLAGLLVGCIVQIRRMRGDMATLRRAMRMRASVEDKKPADTHPAPVTKPPPVPPRLGPEHRPLFVDPTPTTTTRIPRTAATARRPAPKPPAEPRPVLDTKPIKASDLVAKFWAEQTKDSR